MTIRPEELDPAALLRCGADDELCEAGTECLRKHLDEHPEDKARLEFDKELCGAIGRVMSECCAPEGLCDRIRATLADDTVGESLGRRASETRTKSFWARPFGSIASVAATLLLAFVLVQIVTDVVGGDATKLHAAEIRNFVGDQHGGCALGLEPDKFTMTTAEEVPVQFEKLTGTSVSKDDLVVCESMGLRFIEAGQCAVPPRNEAKSVHLRFESDGTHCAEGTAISLFIQPYTGFVEMEPERTYRFDGEGEQTVYGWVRGDVVYYVVADAGEPCELFRKAAGLPEAEALP